MADIVTKLMTEISASSSESGRKVSVVGVGPVGMACAVALLTQNVTNHLVLVDSDEDKVLGEMMDLQHGSSFVNCPTIEGGSDLSVTADSLVCVVSTEAPHKTDESYEDIMRKNSEVFTNLIPSLVKHSPDTVLLIVVSYPVDLLTYLAWKLSGLPTHRVIGSGTNLDSSRLRHLVSEELNMASQSCHGWVIGAHGDSSVAVWSGVNVAGVRLPRRPLPEDEYLDKEDNKMSDCFSLLHKQVVDSNDEVMKLKGNSCWSVGLSVADICRAVINNTQTVHAVSTNVQGVHHVKPEVFLSLPCVLGREGVTRIIKQPLKNEELKRFKDLAKAVNDIIQTFIVSNEQYAQLFEEETKPVKQL